MQEFFHVCFSVNWYRYRTFADYYHQINTHTQTHNCLTDIIQVPSVRNWKILLEQFYCAHALLIATSAFEWGNRC